MQLGALRRSSYVGLAKTRSLHVLIGAAMDLVRIAAMVGGGPASAHADITICEVGTGLRSVASL